jgi:hydroxymethylbilane synthase
MSSRTTIIIGSRKSDLALWQAREILRQLEEAFPSKSFEIKTEISRGDIILDQHLSVLASSSPGIFTKELEEGLLNRSYDLVVHSLKDMPTSLPPSLCLCGVSTREDPRDVLLVAKKHANKHIKSLEDFPPGSVIGTSSVRREANIHRLHPHLVVKSIRGNLNTRLKKLDGEYVDSTNSVQDSFDGLILAAAGVIRLGWSDRIACFLDSDEYPYGVGQGALGVECREDDSEIIAMLHELTNIPTLIQISAERTFMNRLQGGCQLPIAVHTRFTPAVGDFSFRSLATTDISTVSATTCEISGTITNLDGSRNITVNHAASVDLSRAGAVLGSWGACASLGSEIGAALAKKAIQAGAAEILGSLHLTRPITYGAAEERRD